MKNFMDRTRYLHMFENQFAGKVGAAVTNAGLIHGGQETTLRIMEHYLQSQGLHLTDTRDPASPIVSSGVTGSLMADFQDNKTLWRSSAVDEELTAASCKQLGRNMVRLIHRLHQSNTDKIPSSNEQI